MEHKHAHNRSYEDFDPVFKWRREQDRDTIELHLPGFKREQIRIQINHLGFLVISGERPFDGTKWKRFKKEFELPKYCNEDAIRGNFMQNILSVVLPKKVDLIPQEEQEEEEKIPELEDLDKYQEKNTYKSLGFGGRDREEEIGTLSEYTYRTDNKFGENDVETTREVALKFMVVIIVVMVIVNYLVDMSKTVMAQGQSYFQN
ncbi:putative HSP20-like chaperone [Medicago truncatula]|uniref:Hsp20/alpha crystallin family protein n=1 Tax=Medicago truncatula TaxID=3880 RepID=G7L0H2_MEDTR|nr:inactive protein RESTRICTED TEV MOVEMENT 2 [Medicago truncatula]AES80880.1 hsp20/alpha crystallin family protein [Medicago truncatula]RHN47498.1 putative HSP20-like chaperone [Medicago truncatula]